MLMQDVVFQDSFLDPAAQSQVGTFGSDGTDGGPAVHSTTQDNQRLYRELGN